MWVSIRVRVRVGLSVYLLRERELCTQASKKDRQSSKQLAHDKRGAHKVFLLSSSLISDNL
jgi:hypothetical protein